MRIGYLTGVFDLFHIGHLRLIKAAKAFCDVLIVAVITDEAVLERKGKPPIIPYEQRAEIVRAISGVAEVIPQKGGNWHKVVEAHDRLKYDVLFVGDEYYNSEDWNYYDRDLTLRGVSIVYLPYTEGVSTTKIVQAHRGGRQ